MTRWIVLLLTACWLMPAPLLAQENDGDPAAASDPETPADAEPETPADAADDDQNSRTEEAAAAETAPAEESSPAEDPAAAEMAAKLSELQARIDLLDAQLNPPQRNIPRLELTFGGRLQTDVRFRVEEKAIGEWYDRRVLSPGLMRNDNILGLKLEAKVAKFRGVADVDVVWVGIPDEIKQFSDISDRRIVEPFRIEAHNAYLEGKNLAPGLDLRFGIQKVMWGVGDQFNPTNNINSEDLEDPLLFGEQQGNLMLRLDYAPIPELQLTGVVVPVFRPSLLPASSELGLAALDRLPFVDEQLRYRISSEKQLGLDILGNATVAGNVLPVMPDLTPGNMQFAFQVAGQVGGQYLALNYYNGRSDIPQAVNNVTSLVDAPRCENDPEPPAVRMDEPGEDEDCINGYLWTDARLEYPRMQVLGFNWTGEIPGAIGYRLEVGVFFPKETRMAIYNPQIELFGQPFSQEGEYDYDGDGEPGGGERPIVLEGRPFAKWALGIDYTVGPVMINAQWVHGLVDEFGAGDFFYKEGIAVRQSSASEDVDNDIRLFNCATMGEGEKCAAEVTRPKLADYLVVGLDVNFPSRAGLFRVFSLWDMNGYTFHRYAPNQGRRVSEHKSLFTKEGFSASILAEAQFNFGYGFELHAGSLINLGRDYTKFGDPAAGGTIVYVRGKYSF